MTLPVPMYWSPRKVGERIDGVRAVPGVLQGNTVSDPFGSALALYLATVKVRSWSLNHGKARPNEAPPSRNQFWKVNIDAENEIESVPPVVHCTSHILVCSVPLGIRA